MKIIAKQCKACNLIVLLSDFKPHKSGKYGHKATCIQCEDKKKLKDNKDPFNDRIWDERKLPCANNAFLNPNLQSKYNALCEIKTYNMHIKYPYININHIAEILLLGFDLGNCASAEVLSEEMLKEAFL